MAAEDEGGNRDGNWYLARGGQQHCPYTLSLLVDAASKGIVERTDHVWRPGWDNWRLADSVPELFERWPALKLEADETIEIAKAPKTAKPLTRALRLFIWSSSICLVLFVILVGTVFYIQRLVPQ